MDNQIDTQRAIRQHVSMEKFFSGGFAPRTAGASEHGGADTADHDLRRLLDDLAGRISRCRKCPLGSQRTNAVPGQGNPNARLMFVGEAPGAEEDLQAMAFVGRAGQLLGKMITAMGLSRDDVFICNILKCRPPDNRDPRPEEIACCMPYLYEQLDIIRPEVIVALGAHAARTLLDSTSAIGKLRGVFHDYSGSEGGPPVKLMATYHPAYLLRNYSHENRSKVWLDMKKVLGALDLPVPTDNG